MFRYFYATTQDRKKNTHQYKLPAGEAVPAGHEITDLSIAGQFQVSELLSGEDIQALKSLFPGHHWSKGKNAKA